MELWHKIVIVLAGLVAATLLGALVYVVNQPYQPTEAAVKDVSCSLIGDPYEPGRMRVDYTITTGVAAQWNITMDVHQAGSKVVVGQWGHTLPPTEGGVHKVSTEWGSVFNYQTLPHNPLTCSVARVERM